MVAAIFLIAVLPFVYFYDEALAIFSLELFSCVYFLTGYFNKNRKPFVKQKALLAIVYLLGFLRYSEVFLYQYLRILHFLHL
jgi:hypothetical protein